MRRVAVCVVAAKGGAAMYDYVKALQKRFVRQEYPKLAEQVVSSRIGPYLSSFPLGLF